MASTRQPPHLEVFRDPIEPDTITTAPTTSSTTTTNPSNNSNTIAGNAQQQFDFTAADNALSVTEFPENFQLSNASLQPALRDRTNVTPACGLALNPPETEAHHPSPVKQPQPSHPAPLHPYQKQQQQQGLQQDVQQDQLRHAPSQPQLQQELVPAPPASRPIKSPKSKLGYVPLSAPKPASFSTDSPPKQQPPPPPMSTFYPPPVANNRPNPATIAQQALFTTFSSVPDSTSTNTNSNGGIPISYNVGNNIGGQPQLPVNPYPAGSNNNENYRRPSTSSSAGAPVTGKRTLMEAAPLRERPIKKQKQDNPETTEIPEPHNMPPVDDDGSKPPFSYAVLIGMAILRAPNRRLTLAQIYKWISDSFSHYRPGDSGWQNSIRHNLSLNKAFVKQERPKDDPGKGNYWTIQPGMEAQFMKDKIPRRPATMGTMSLPQPVSSTPAEPQQEQPYQQDQQQQQRQQPRQPQPQPQPRAEANRRANSNVNNTVLPPAPRPSHAKTNSTHNADDNNAELSSDATLTASDPALNEDSGDETIQPKNARRSSIQGQSFRSSPPQVIKSSPPVAAAQRPPPPPPPVFTREATPPTPSRPSTSSAAIARPRKRTASTMNDSGYFSSLESSAMRPEKARRISTSDIDIEPPRIKRGRAEEEIARIRSSSHDTSPIRPGTSREKPIHLAPGSSPMRNPCGAPPQSFSPRHKPLMKTLKPPISLSPSTSLREHRKKMERMINSPIKRMGLAHNNGTNNNGQPYSPAFKLAEDNGPAVGEHLQVPPFDLFPANHSSPSRGSPAKFPMNPDPRGPLEFGATSPRPQVYVEPDTPPHLKPHVLAGLKYGTNEPLPKPKRPGVVEVTCDDDDWFSFSMFDDLEEDTPEAADAAIAAAKGEDLEGVDILKGFQKIGSDTYYTKEIGPSNIMAPPVRRKK